MDPASLYSILIPVASVTIMITVTGLCCIKSMVTRSTIDLRNRIAEVEQHLQYQIQQMHTTLEIPRTPTLHTIHAMQATQSPPSPHAYYYNTQTPPYYTV